MGLFDLTVDFAMGGKSEFAVLSKHVMDTLGNTKNNVKGFMGLFNKLFHGVGAILHHLFGAVSHFRGCNFRCHCRDKQRGKSGGK